MITIITSGKAYKATLKEDATGFAVNVFAPDDNKMPIFGTRFGLRASFEKDMMQWIKLKCQLHSENKVQTINIF
jgi:hypothetical protein